MLTKPAAIVVIGLDKDGKPRAATFSGNDIGPATKAANIMNLQIGRAESPQAIAMVKQLPLGRVFATGKGFMPLVKRELYEKLLKELKLEDPKPAAAGEHNGGEASPAKPGSEDETAAVPATASPASSAATPAPSPLNPWSAIAVGATVLWSTDPKEGWFPCTVTGASKDGKKLTLKWRDYPNFKPFDVKRHAVGLISVGR